MKVPSPTARVTARPSRAAGPAAWLLALLVLLPLTSTACGGAQPGTEAWEREVRSRTTDVTLVNRTRDTLEIRLTREGRTETFGSIAPLSRQGLTRLAPGQVLLELATFDGQVLHRRPLELVGGEPVTVDIEAEEATLEVVSPLSQDVDILVDGRRIGRVAAGQTGRFPQIPAGRRVLVARAVVGPMALQDTVVLTPGATHTWRLPVGPGAAAGPTDGPTPPAGMGLLLFTNGGASEIELLVDDEVQGRVAPGQSLEVPLTPGTHRIHARIAGTQIRTEQTLSVTAGQLARWDYGR